MQAAGGVWLTGAFLAALVGLRPATARAQAEPASVALEYAAERDCTPRAELARQVEARLGRPVFVEQDADVLVEVKTKRREDAAGWVANLTLRARHGNWLGARELQSESARCSGLDQPLSLVLALMVDIPKDELPPPAEIPVQAPPPAPRVVRVPAPPIVPRAKAASARTERKPPFRVVLGVSGVLSAGLLPDLALGLRASILLRPPEFWPVELGGVVYRDARAQVSRGGSDFEAAGADIAVCPLGGERGRVTVLACAAQSLGRMHVSGYGFDQNQEHSRFYSSFGLRARLSLALTTWLAGRLAASAEVPVTRDEFYFVNERGERERVFRSAPVVGTAELGMELRF
ncbi:MAG TPA: hypothetical protein VI072_06240 [Polyangiaceae bacterium]